ncbi:MAG TPA: hypothetical protein VLA12_02970, partial [Planctomycetaceae bacterium]|nr:hypothetical protein [Planctomycetaceae bacterium]
GCLNKNKGDKAKVATNMMRDNLLTRAVIREGVSRSNIPRDHHAVSREVVVDVMAGNTKDDVLQWIDESDSTMPDWSMF